MAIILQQNETKVQPDLKLLGVKPGQVNARNVINVSLQNPQAAYLNQLHLINTVSKEAKRFTNPILRICKWRQTLTLVTNFFKRGTINAGKICLEINGLWCKR